MPKPFYENFSLKMISNYHANVKPLGHRRASKTCKTHNLFAFDLYIARLRVPDRLCPIALAGASSVPLR